MGKLLTRYDNKTNNIIKQFKKKNIEFRTPRIADRILNSKSANNKSNSSILVKNKNPSTKSNSSFCTKKSSKFLKDNTMRKKSSSSSPEIRNSPNDIAIAKIKSNIDFASLKSKLNANVFKNSQSFIDSITKREVSNNSLESKSTKLKYTTIGVLNEDNFKSLFTRNLPNQALEEKSSENLLKESINLKKKPIIGIT